MVLFSSLGVVVYVSRKLQAEQDEINGIVASLGGGFRWQYGSDVTHLIFTGKAKDLSKEFRMAKKDGKHVVGPGWVKMCRDEAKLVEEELFPHTYNPKMTLDISVMSQANNTRRATRKKNCEEETTLMSTRVEEEEEPQQKEASSARKKLRKSRDREEDEEDDDEDMEDTKLLERKAGEQEVNPSVINEHLAKLDQLMDKSNQQKSSPQTRRSMKMALTSAEATPDRSAEDKLLDKHGKVSGDLSSQNPDSQAIQWKDPKEEAERQKLIAKMEKESQALMSGSQEAGPSMVSFSNFDMSRFREKKTFFLLKCLKLLKRYIFCQMQMLGAFSFLFSLFRIPTSAENGRHYCMIESIWL